MNELIKEINGMLKNHVFEYAFCGGYAIDLFLNKQTRPHGDVDVMTYRKYRDDIIVYIDLALKRLQTRLLKTSWQKGLNSSIS